MESSTTSSRAKESSSLEEKNGGFLGESDARIPGSPREETEANIFPEGETQAEADMEEEKREGADVEKGGPPPAFDPSKMFPDGGLEAVSLFILKEFLCDDEDDSLEC